MSLNEKQTRALSARLNHRHVKTRTQAGHTIPYVEGWHAISEANRIFGFDSWDRVTVSPKCLWATKERGAVSCFYQSKVRISVRAGDTVTVREGIGTGFASNALPELAHELALKASETDATKRALATFGNPFGLALYDKSGARVTKPKSPKVSQGLELALVSCDGTVRSVSDVDHFVVEIRAGLVSLCTLDDIYSFWERHLGSFTLLRDRQPFGGDLVIAYLVHLFKSWLKEIGGRSIEPSTASSEGGDLTWTKDAPSESEPSRPTLDKDDQRTSTREDKVARGPYQKERRLRNKAHLAFVAQQPCLICGRRPTHAHHVRFAQRRALSLKVSDEYTVPLCAIHHGELHRVGDERQWWASVGIVDPLSIARRFWLRTQGREDDGDASALNSNRSEIRSEIVSPLTKVDDSGSPRARTESARVIGGEVCRANPGVLRTSCGRDPVENLEVARGEGHDRE